MPKSGQPWDPEFATRSALFTPFMRWTAPFAGRPEWPSSDDYTALCEQSRLESAADLEPLVFARSRPRPRRFRRERVAIEELYDGSIARLGQVPCVEASYHDLWNAVAFAAFPRAKRALHARQYRALVNWVEVGATRLPPARTREQDALTVFDEGGSVVLVNAALRERFERGPVPLELPGVDRFLLFGHALMEHLSYTRLELRSCAVLLAWEQDSVPELTWVDRELELRVEDPARFREPGADGVVVLDRRGRLWLERPRSSESLPIASELQDESTV
jgi:hypothetical protein